MLVNLNEVLKDAQNKHYAVGLFNTIDIDMFQAAIEVAEEMKSPIIVGTAEVLLPYGSLELISPSVLAQAKKASVPVVVHYDHGLTFDKCMEALKHGFSSVMYDGSARPYKENIAQTRELVKIAHIFGATVEGEIGHVGNADAGDGSCADLYTTPEQAMKYVNETGVDALAIAIGTAHGKYIKKPKLDIGRLKEIRGCVSTPLVLHGGSGLSDEDFKKCIKEGIAKVNIFTDLCLAAEKATKLALDEGVGYLGIRSKKMEFVKEVVKKNILLFGSAGRA